MGWTEYNWLLFVLLLLANVINGDDKCMTKNEAGQPTETCLDDLDKGINCDGDSAVESCFKNCQNTKVQLSYYASYVQQMQILEKAICDAKLDKDVNKNAKCIKSMFMICKDSYTDTWTDKKHCEALKAPLETCKQAIAAIQADCNTFVEAVHNVFIARCGASALHVTSTALFLVLFTLLYTNKYL